MRAVVLQLSASLPARGNGPAGRTSGGLPSLSQTLTGLRSGIHDDRVVAVRKVGSRRARNPADLLVHAQKHLRRIEVVLRDAPK